MFGQGVEQWKLFNQARPVEEVLASPMTTSKEKHALLLVKEAKKFAVENLGLAATKSYSQYVKLDRDTLLWAVAGSDPVYLKEKTWWFPFAGTVPYKGFFKLEKANEEAANLAKEGLDVWVREVPAFSSLGWLPDPIYSSMLDGPDYNIVNTVVHESVHATVWIPGSVDFNERLASFVGRQGSVLWLNQKFGKESKERQAAEAHYRAAKKFGLLVRYSMARYHTEVESLADAGKIDAAKTAKARFYQWFVGEAKSIGYTNKELEKWNNAALLAYSKYYYDESVFEALLRKCAGDLSRFVRWVKAENDKGHLKDAPEDRLKTAAQEEPCVE